jgi:hypothetical protein
VSHSEHVHDSVPALARRAFIGEQCLVVFRLVE